MYALAYTFAAAYKALHGSEADDELRQNLSDSSHIVTYLDGAILGATQSLSGAASSIATWVGMELIKGYVQEQASDAQERMLEDLRLVHSEIENLDPSSSIGDLADTIQSTFVAMDVPSSKRDLAKSALTEVQTMIPDELPSDFPYTQVIVLADVVDDSIANSVRGNRVLYWFDPSGSATQFAMIGHLRSHVEASSLAGPENQQAGDQITSAGFVLGAGAGVLGYGAVKVGAFFGGMVVGSLLVQAPAFGLGAGAFTTVAGLFEVVDIYRDEAVYPYYVYDLHMEALYNAHLELDAEVQCAEGMRDYLEDLLGQSSAWPSLAIDRVQLDDVITQEQLSQVEVSGEINIRNTGSLEGKVNAFLVVEGLNRTLNPSFIAYWMLEDPFTLNGGISGVIPVQFQVPTADGLPQLETYRVHLYVSLGPEVQEVEFDWKVGQMATVDLLNTQTRQVPLSGELSEGEWATATYRTGSSTRTVVFRMEYPGSDFNFHVYDAVGNHVGWTPNGDESNIPGAVYSGSDTNPEVVIIDSPGEESYTVSVHAVQVSRASEHFSVSVTEIPEYPPLLAVCPSPLYIQIAGELEVNANLRVWEQGGHQSLTGISASCSSLVGPLECNIPGERISVSLGATDLMPAEATTADVNILLFTGLPDGDYKGTVNFSWGAGLAEIPIILTLTGPGEAPLANAGPDRVVECACNGTIGTRVTLDGSASTDPDGDPLTYIWTGPFVEGNVTGPRPTVTLSDGCPGNYMITLVVNDGNQDSPADEVVITLAAWLTSPVEAVDMCGNVSITNDFSTFPYQCGKTGSVTVTWTATDDIGNPNSCSATFTIEDPTAEVTYDGDLLVSTDGNTAVSAYLAATLRDGDANALEIDDEWVTFTLVGEGDEPKIVATARSENGVARVLKVLEPAIYEIQASLHCSGLIASAILVVYNPDGGFATGGGWIIPEDDGLNTHPDERANFGFKAKYKQDSPTGHLEFRYSDGFIDLKSTSIDQLVITGGKIVQFKGWASVNKVDGHWFFVKAIDNGEPGSSDTFEIKIWAPGVDPEGDPTERAGGVLQGGNIVVQTK
jgi:hypothetical protein